MSRLAVADRIQSTEECPTQGGHSSEGTGLNTGINPAEGMQQSSRELISDAVLRRASKYTFYESEKTPLDAAVQACNVKFLEVFLDSVDLDEQVKTRMVCSAYTNFFHHEFSQITKDHLSVVKRLLELGGDVNGGPSVFPLSVATKAGSYPLVELLCQHGADLNKTDTRYWNPPLTIAAEGGHYDIIEVMLKFGAKVHGKPLCFSPIYQAIVHGHTDCAKLLLRYGANFDVGTALYSFIDKQSVAYINSLTVSYRHETQQYISNHQQDLLIFTVRGNNIEFISHIFDIVFNITGEYPCWEELLAESRHGEVATFLIQKGADVNKLVETRGGYTPLYLILLGEYMDQASKLQVVKVLLENGASPNICGETSPLMLSALTNNSTDLLQLLLDYGADINWRDNKGDTAFYYSIYQGCDSNAEFLIRCTKDKHFINSQNNVGLTALMQAARYNNVALLTGVINHNPNMNMTDSYGNTALLHAINRKNCYGKDWYFRNRTDFYYNDMDVDIITTLINAGCDVNLQNDDGVSPLMLAAGRYSKEVVQILLDAGADINAVSKTDRTKTALSYFQPVSYIHINNITACPAVFLAQGAWLSYLQPKMFHTILLCNDSYAKLITNVTGPRTVRSDEYIINFLLAYPTFDISPLCSALLSGNATLAHHFFDIMWLTKSDLTSLIYNKPVCSYLEMKNYKQCLNLLGEMSSQPVSLFRLAFAEVSSAVGTTPGRVNRVNMLPLPWLLKDKLLFKSAVDFIAPTIDRIPFLLLRLGPSPKRCIDALDFCKCCRVWQNLKLHHKFGNNSKPCFICDKHKCSECFLACFFRKSSPLWRMDENCLSHTLNTMGPYWD